MRTGTPYRERGIGIGSTKIKIVLLLLGAVAWTIGIHAQTGGARYTGTVVDPAGRAVAGAQVDLVSATGARSAGTSGSDGGFDLALPAWGVYLVRVEAAGFAEITRTQNLSAVDTSTVLRLERVKTVAEEVVVSADAGEI